MKRFINILLLTLIITPVFAQTFNRGRIKQNSYFERIPYKKIGGLPVVQVTINGKEYNFLFDTGAMFTISDKLYKDINPPVISEKSIGDISGQRKKMKIVRFPELQLQDITFKNTRGIVLHEDNKYYECVGIDGFIGSNMLRNSVVHIDEQNMQIIITNNIKNLSLVEPEYQEMKLFGNQSRPYIVITLQKGEKRVREKVLFDSGMAGFLKLYINSAISYNDVVELIMESEGSSLFGIHGSAPKQKHLLFNIPELVIGNYLINNVKTRTLYGSDSSIGAELFEYGAVTLNFKNKQFNFSAYSNINTDKLSMKPENLNFNIQNGKLVVGIIWDKTLEATVNLGDEVLGINGVDIQSWDICQLYLLRNIPKIDKTYIELRDINTKEIKKIEYKRMK